jgi:hypothetical protein
MKYGLLIGWGIVIYAVMFLAWSGLVMYGFDGALPRIITLLLLVVLTTIAGRSLRLHLWTDIAPYSVLWAMMMALLDTIFVVPFSGWSIYNDTGLWIGYAVVILVPLIAPKMHTLLDNPTHDT